VTRGGDELGSRAGELKTSSHTCSKQACVSMMQCQTPNTTERDAAVVSNELRPRAVCRYATQHVGSRMYQKISSTKPQNDVMRVG
jgi:hypothetical protein